MQKIIFDNLKTLNGKKVTVLAPSVPTVLLGRQFPSSDSLIKTAQNEARTIKALRLH
jgi:hypothetical protein